MLLSGKRDLVSELADKIAAAKVVGIADIANLPAEQFQAIRQKLRESATVVVVKNTLLRLALQKATGSRERLKPLLDFVRGQTGIILTEMDAFKLSKLLKESRTNAPARPGSQSSRDITIPAGETDLPPGPVLGEFQRAGIKARIQAGKVVVLEDCLLVKTGDVITAEISDILAKFNILPVELGLRLRAAFQEGLIFTSEILEIDEEKTLAQLRGAAGSAFNLAVNVRYPTGRTVGIFIGEVVRRARSLALTIRYPAKEVVSELLAIARVEMLGLASVAGQKNDSALDEELKGLVLRAQPVAPPAEKEGKPAEEKPKERWFDWNAGRPLLATSSDRGMKEVVKHARVYRTRRAQAGVPRHGDPRRRGLPRALPEQSRRVQTLPIRARERTHRDGANVLLAVSLRAGGVPRARGSLGPPEGDATHRQATCQDRCTRFGGAGAVARARLVARGLRAAQAHP